MSIFSENLKKLRNINNVTQKQVAEYISLSVRGIQRYESGEQQPTLPILITLSNYFHVSLDYLVGRTDNPQHEYCLEKGEQRKENLDYILCPESTEIFIKNQSILTLKAEKFSLINANKKLKKENQMLTQKLNNIRKIATLCHEK